MRFWLSDQCFVVKICIWIMLQRHELHNRSEIEHRLCRIHRLKYRSRGTYGNFFQIRILILTLTYFYYFYLLLLGLDYRVESTRMRQAPHAYLIRMIRMHYAPRAVPNTQFIRIYVYTQCCDCCLPTAAEFDTYRYSQKSPAGGNALYPLAFTLQRPRNGPTQLNWH